MNSKIPQFVSHVTERLQKAGFEAYLVGGCVRDLIMDKQPKDWDITTNARPEEIQNVFSELKTLYENKFGTVTVINIPKEREDREVSRENLDEEVQITTYRSEGKYTDSRHPDSVSYETQLEKDLERRDFTMNAIAWDPFGTQGNTHNGHFIDPYNGQKDIKDKVIKSVLYASDRFQEDALRMMRAVRFSTVLNFAIEKETLDAISKHSDLLKNISPERIRDEFIKIVNSTNPALGVDLLQKTGLLKYIIPELEEGIGCDQKGAHIYDVYTHILHAFQHSADKGYNTVVRLSAMFHDIGKPRTRRYDAKRDKYTFFGHEVVGANMTRKIMERLRFPRETTDLVTKMVRNHMFFSDTEQISLSAVRRIVKNVGVEYIWHLMEVRECDRVGMKKAEAPYRLRKYHAMIEEVLHDPISVTQLKIDGEYMIKELGIKPGPRMGWMLHALLEEVLDNPELNTIEKLSERVKDLNEQTDEDLKKMGEKAREKKDAVEGEQIKNIHKKHRV